MKGTPLDGLCVVPGAGDGMFWLSLLLVAVCLIKMRSLLAGPTLILPSPVKPVMLPVSVIGQNNLGKVQVVSNQVT